MPIYLIADSGPTTIPTFFRGGLTYAFCVDAPRTDSCSNRCALQIFFIPLSGENPETVYAYEVSFPTESFRANAIAFPQSVRPLRCFEQKKFLKISLKPQKVDLEEDIPPNHLVRVVNAAVNRLDDTIFDTAFPGVGRDSYISFNF